MAPDLKRLEGDCDSFMPKICEPYYEFLNTVANAVPKDSRKVLDLGVGTGNLSYRVQERIPEVHVHGIDMNEGDLEIAKNRLKNFTSYCVPFSEARLPKGLDCVYSSMALHHLSTEERERMLLKIADSSKLLLNFDFFIPENGDKADLMEMLRGHVSKHFDDKGIEELKVAYELYDNPMRLNEARDIFVSNGFIFNILDQKEPFSVYSVSRLIN